MIANVTGYKYLVGDGLDAAHPHGDLDRISITGSNYAVAGGPIYGEPVAWTMECLLAREAAFEAYEGIGAEFSRVISGYQMHAVTTAFNAMNAYPFVYPTQLTSAKTVNRVSTTIEDALPDAFNWTRYGRHLVEVVSSGDPVKSKPVDDMTFYMSDFGRGVMKAHAGDRDLWPEYADIRLSGQKYEVGGYRVDREPSYYNGRRKIWAASGNGKFFGGEWHYAAYDYRLSENSNIVIHAGEEELRYMDFVRPIFLVSYTDSLEYSDTGYKFNRSYNSVYVSGRTYRFDANGDVTISASDLFDGFAPETPRIVYLPEAGHEDDAEYHMKHSEEIGWVWLVGSLKSDVVNR